MDHQTTASDLQPTAGQYLVDLAQPWSSQRLLCCVQREDGDTWIVGYDGGKKIEKRAIDYKGILYVNFLITSGLSEEDCAPFFLIRKRAFHMLYNAPGYKIALSQFIEDLKSEPQLEPDKVEPTLRMLLAMDLVEFSSQGGGEFIKLGRMACSHYDRVSYLAAFADSLLAKSARIDNLIKHTGVVGSYREELLRGLLRELLPNRYEVATGFIESCPRQIDILVYDAQNYAPLLREGNLVVVPAEAVRAVIEVKTQLYTDELDEALELLDSVSRAVRTYVPVFRGIFAYEQGYTSDRSIAERINTFYSGPRELMQYFQEITGVCVPRKSVVFSRYSREKDDAWYRPCLFSVESEWPGDVQTAVFLSLLFDYLDLPRNPKKVIAGYFGELQAQLDPVHLLDLGAPDWQPRSWLTHADASTPEAAAQLLHDIDDFFEGKVSSEELLDRLFARRAKGVPR